MICTLSAKQDLWSVQDMLGLTAVYPENLKCGCLQCRWSVSESTIDRQDRVRLSSTGRQNRSACSFQHCSEHQYNKTYSFCCFYLMKAWMREFDGDKFCCFLLLEINWTLNRFWSFRSVSQMFFFPQSDGSLMCLHLLAVLVQVNGDSAVAKKNKWPFVCIKITRLVSW